MPNARRTPGRYIATGYHQVGRPARHRGALADLDASEPAYPHIVRALAALALAGFDVEDADLVQRAIAAGRAKYGEEPLAPLPEGHLVRCGPNPRRGEVVYYMRIGNRCKIGYSGNITSRMKTINPEELLATEPGTEKLERQRHAEFGDLRVHGEWFRLEEPLTSHIAELKQRRKGRKLTKRPGS
jgi:hypothetical protein